MSHMTDFNPLLQLPFKCGMQDLSKDKSSISYISREHNFSVLLKHTHNKFKAFPNLLNKNVIEHCSKLPRKSVKSSKTPSKANVSWEHHK